MQHSTLEDSLFQQMKKKTSCLLITLLARFCCRVPSQHMDTQTATAGVSCPHITVLISCAPESQSSGNTHGRAPPEIQVSLHSDSLPPHRQARLGRIKPETLARSNAAQLQLVAASFIRSHNSDVTTGWEQSTAGSASLLCFDEMQVQGAQTNNN